MINRQIGVFCRLSSRVSIVCRGLSRGFTLTASNEVERSRLNLYKSRTRARSILDFSFYIIFYNTLDTIDSIDNIEASTLFRVEGYTTSIDYPRLHSKEKQPWN